MTRRPLHALLSALVLLVACGPAPDPEAADEAFFAGNLLAGEGRQAEALAAYDAAIARGRNDALVHGNRGFCLASLGRLEEAAKAFRTAHEREPSSIWSSLYHEGECWRLLGRLERAAAAYREQLVQDPEHMDARLRLAQLLFEAGETEAALAQHEANAAHHPRSSLAHRGRGDCLLVLERHEEAVEAYTRALGAGTFDLVPSTVQEGEVADRRTERAAAWFGRGRALDALGRTHEAWKDFNSAAASDEGHVEAARERDRLAELLAR